MPGSKELAELQQKAREAIMKIYAAHADEVAEVQLDLLHNSESDEVKRGVASDIAKQIMGSPTQRIEQDIRALHLRGNLGIPEEKMELNPQPIEIKAIESAPAALPQSNRDLHPPIMFPVERKPFSLVERATGPKSDEPPKSSEPSVVPE